jgi:hypothetical protein
MTLQLLLQVCCCAGIPIHFSKATSQVIEQDDGLIGVIFEDGKSRIAKLLFHAVRGKWSPRGEIVVEPYV